MDGTSSIMELSDRLNFMYNKISIPKMSMVYWMKVPEFVAEMLERFERGDTIDDQSVYPVMKKVYEHALGEKGTKRAEVYNYA